MKRFYCKCGCYFDKLMQLSEHIGLQNLHEHGRVSEREWRIKRIEQYRSLREGPEQ